MSDTLPASPVSEVVDEVVARVRALATDASDASDARAVEAMVAALRAADALTAYAVEQIARLAPGGGIERASGLPVEQLLTLAARRPGWEARALTQTASALRSMPATKKRFARGELSTGEIRAIAGAVRRLDADARARVDQVVEAARAADAEPEALLDRVDTEAARQREDLLVAREDHAIERSFLSLQPRLDGLGGSFYGEADTIAFATLCEAIDTFAPRPTSHDDEADACPRAQQRLDGLIMACEAALAGGGSSRSRPRFTISVDARDPTAGARVLWRAHGRPGRLSQVEAQTQFCDAEVQAIIFNDGRPISVGDIHAAVSAKARAALIARDAGCRFPGCGMPAAWTDAHHVNGRAPGATQSIDDLVLLCRRCHRRVHRHKWKITVHHDASISFGHRGRTHTTQPRIPRPKLE